jgi:hypothetical protein
MRSSLVMIGLRADFFVDNSHVVALSAIQVLNCCPQLATKSTMGANSFGAIATFANAAAVGIESIGSDKLLHNSSCLMHLMLGMGGGC